MYQDIGGDRVEVASAYALGEGSGAYGFHLGAYDPTQPLVLDPAVFVYSGFIGGAGADSGNGIDVDSAGQAYVVGTTDSTACSFPVAVGPDLTFNGGDSDAFVAKVRADGTGLVFAGYIGGSGTDSGNGIAVDPAGNAYVTGTTDSTEATFPVRVGPDLTFNGGFSDAFVAKIAFADTEPPVAQCMDITIPAGETCHVNDSIDNGSFSPDGAPLTCTQTPSGPYPVGTTSVTLTCTDTVGLSSSCTADVTVAY